MSSSPRGTGEFAVYNGFITTRKNLLTRLDIVTNYLHAKRRKQKGKGNTMATRGISVKLPIEVVIKQLEEKKKEMDYHKENYSTIIEKLDKEEEKWEKEVAKAALPKLTKLTPSVRENTYTNEMVIEYRIETAKLPPKPIQDRPNSPTTYLWKEDYEALATNLRLLKLAQDGGQTTISTSTYKAIAKFL
jgi:hypothetical protein